MRDTAPAPSPSGPGAILSLVRSGRAVTRASLAAVTGLSRSTVSERLDALAGEGLIVPARGASSTGGRPAGAFMLNPDWGVLLAAQVSATHVDVAVGTIEGACKEAETLPIKVSDGPERVLPAIRRAMQRVLRSVGRAASEVRGISVGLPGPIEYAIGRAVQPPGMPGWDDVVVPAAFASEFGCRVLVDNEVNLMAVGEHRAVWPRTGDMMFIKCATGIGLGLIAGGALQRGAQGGAGEIGHGSMPGLSADEAPLCRCGCRGCLEAYASGWRLAERLHALGRKVATPGDVAWLARQGDSEALLMLREAGETIGLALAHAVSLLNPSLLVIGGDLTLHQDHLLATIKRTVISRAVPLATRDLQIVPSRLGNAAGLQGGVHLLIDELLSPALVDRTFRSTP